MLQKHFKHMFIFRGYLHTAGKTQYSGRKMMIAHYSACSALTWCEFLHNFRPFSKPIPISFGQSSSRSHLLGYLRSAPMGEDFLIQWRTAKKRVWLRRRRYIFALILFALWPSVINVNLKYNLCVLWSIFIKVSFVGRPLFFALWASLINSNLKYNLCVLWSIFIKVSFVARPS